MKIAAAVLAVVVAGFAPVATAAPTCNNAANAATLQALQVSNQIKRKTVQGGKTVVQMIKIKNTASTTATGIELGSGPIPPDLTYRTAKGGHFTWTVDPQGPYIASSLTNIPAKKTLKVSITYTAAQCPTQANPHEVSLSVQIPADGNFGCFLSIQPRPQFTIKKSKKCA